MPRSRQRGTALPVLLGLGVTATLTTGIVVAATGGAGAAPAVGGATISTTHHVVTHGDKDTLTASLAPLGPAGDGQRAQLQRLTQGGGTWTAVPGAKTQKTGAASAAHPAEVSWTITPNTTRGYRVVFPDTSGALVTPTVTVGVRQLIHVTSPTTLTVKGHWAMTGVVHPKGSGVVAIARKTKAGNWVVVRHAKVHEGAFSRSMPTLSGSGTQAYRLTIAASATNLAAKAIVHEHVAQPTLSEGATGAEVKLLQHDLRVLKYDVPSDSGTFDDNTLHAVVAFQKVQRMSRTGVVTAAVWAKLAHPTLIHPRHTHVSGTAVEVDLARQVLLLTHNGKLERIVDASTAGGYYYTDSEGNQELAVTPTGHFTIQYKIDHWEHARLGYLYRPAFFTDTGYAIHGETSVPSYPASHGCVRVTVSAMNRLYSKFPIGMNVWIYAG